MDRGHYSKTNQQFLKENPIITTNEQARQLERRRSGVEALIGQVKAKVQLKKSRMKTDLGTLSSGLFTGPNGE